MTALEDLKSLLEKEITKVTAKGDITPVDLKNLGDAVDILKDIETINAMHEYGSDDESYSMSNRGYSSRGMSRYYPDVRYPDDVNYRGRSRHTEREEMISKMETMLGKTSNEQDRRTLMECIDKLERE